MAPEISPDATLDRPVPEDREGLLVTAARQGDDAALREIYRTYREPVWALTVSLIGDPLQAQDVVQIVFFKVFRGLAGFRRRSSLFTWIYRIARNECRSHLRRREVPAVPLEDILGSRFEADGREASTERQARADLLRRAVNRLPFKMREVVVLKYQEDMSYEEMSRILRCPPGTVASRLNRALAELEARLRPLGGCR
ncbi:MAG TPA: sigma-70 family RNA polymerase sigma factor [Acidobacteriota bacterium]|nr:sigma-70 family RNA polymerase sigma factor [Acidobacteriota bacterium]